MFEYFEPETIDEAFLLLNKYGSEAKILAGGTDLLVNVRQKAVEPRYVVNVKKISDLSSKVDDENTGLRIGALTLLHNIDTHPKIRKELTAIAEAAHEIGSLQIRNMGTIGGNISQDRKCVYYNQSHINLFMRQSLARCWAKGGSICHAAGKDSLFHSLVGAKKCWASCCSDMLIALVCFNATVEIRSPDGSRSLPAKDFWPGPEAGMNGLNSKELVSEIHVPSFPSGTRSLYLKYKRDPRDFAVVSVAARVDVGGDDTCNEAAIVLGGVTPVPLRAKEVEKELKGKRLDRRIIDEVTQLVLKDARKHGPCTEFKVTKTRSLIKDALSALSNKENQYSQN
jgi:CO/xanthine dehydrogenase FAD-binding subunit